MERCPKCTEGVLCFRWFAGKLRLVCLNRACRMVFDAGYQELGALPEGDAMYEGRETA